MVRMIFVKNILWVGARHFGGLVFCVAYLNTLNHTGRKEVHAACLERQIREQSWNKQTETPCGYKPNGQCFHFCRACVCMSHANTEIIKAALFVSHSVPGLWMSNRVFFDCTHWTTGLDWTCKRKWKKMMHIHVDGTVYWCVPALNGIT